MSRNIADHSLLIFAYAVQYVNAGYFSASIARFDVKNGVVPYSSPVPVSIAQYPFMAWFMHSVLPVECYATIVDKRLLVTAASCNPKHHQRRFYLTVGADTTKGVGDIYEIETIKSHPNFREDILDFDIAVIVLKEDLRFNDKVKPIAVANEFTSFGEDDFFTSLGFGFRVWKSYSNEEIYSPQLFKAYLPFVDQKKCQAKLEGFSIITNNMICVGDSKSENNAQCHFKSGGPLIYRGQLIGVMSFGHDGTPCSLPGSPTVFASVVTSRQFIDNMRSGPTLLNYDYVSFR